MKNTRQHVVRRNYGNNTHIEIQIITKLVLWRCCIGSFPEVLHKLRHLTAPSSFHIDTLYTLIFSFLFSVSNSSKTAPRFFNYTTTAA